MAVYIKLQECKVRKISATTAVQICGDPPYEIALRFAGCNLKCLLCFAAGYSYADKFPRNKDVTSNVPIMSLIDDFKAIPKPERSNGYNWLRILGGEPLLSEEHTEYLFDAIIQMVETDSSKFNNKIVIQTNGIHIGRGNIQILAKKMQNLYELNPKVLVVIETSIKGTNPNEFQMVTQSPKNLYEYNMASYFNLKQLGLINLRPMIVAGFGINTSSLIGKGQNKITLHGEGRPFYHPDNWSKKFKLLYDDFTTTNTSLSPLFSKMPMYGIEDRPNWRWAFPALKRGREHAPNLLYDNKFSPALPDLEEKFEDIKKFFFFESPSVYYPAMLKC